MTKRIVVVGAVAAGMSAASQAKRRRSDAQLVVFEKGSDISYGACGMPYNLADAERSIEDLAVLTPQQAIEERGIDLHLRHEVTHIDREARQVVVRNHDSGEDHSEPYDALILATGARPRTLERLPHMDHERSLVLRTLQDGRKLKPLLHKDARRAVILGGGYIGLEMCESLQRRGIQVTIIEKTPQILPGWHTETVARVMEELKDHEIAVHTDETVVGAEQAEDGSLAALVTSSQKIPADLVLTAVGIQPNAELAAAAGLRIGASGAIWVNQYQQTSDEMIWAAGDCCEAYHRILRKNSWLPLGTTANKQGRIAGANASGESLRFRGIVGTAGFKVFDLEVARSGLSLEEARKEGFEPVMVTIRQRSRGHSFPGGAPVYVTLFADGPSGLLLGGEIVGKDGAVLRINTLAAALAAHLNVADLQGMDLVYAPPFAPVWDPLLVAANQLIKKIGK